MAAAHGHVNSSLMGIERYSGSYRYGYPRRLGEITREIILRLMENGNSSFLGVPGVPGVPSEGSQAFLRLSEHDHWNTRRSSGCSRCSAPC